MRSGRSIGPVAPATPPSAWRLGTVLLLAGVAAYACSTLLRHAAGGGRSVLWDDVVYNAIPLLAAALVAHRASTRTHERRVWVLVAVGLALQAVAGTAYSLDTAGVAPGVTATLAGAGLLAYLAIYGAVVLRLRLSLARVGPSVWLDGLVAALGIATLCAAFVLQPIIDHTASDGGTVAPKLINPIADLALLCMLGTAIVLVRREMEASWWLFAAGIGLYALADASFAVRSAAGRVEDGTVLDVGWPAGAALLALAALRAPRPQRLLGRLAGDGLLALPALSGAAAVAVLLADHAVAYDWFVPILAAATLVAVTLRAALAFREVRSLAEQRRLALTDDLTGLANRRKLQQRLDAVLDAGEPVALLLVDLDRFKVVNDSLGHGIGDELLRRVGPRLAAAARPGDTVARLGGDEFAILLRRTTEVERAIDTAVRVSRILSPPLPLDGLALQLSASTGIALAPQHGTDAVELLRAADVAMYRAKERRDAYEVYDPAGDQGGRERLQRMDELRNALDRGELVVHYQPVVRLSDGVTERVEALVRWQHPRLGLLPPHAFLPLAEQAGLVGRLTVAVLEQALADCAAWRERYPPVAVAVNLSASSLVDPRLPGTVRRALAGAGLLGDALLVEITEDALATEPERARAALAALRASGLALAIDDYGSGYSSLAHLRDLRVDGLKLDRSFVTGLAGDDVRRAIVAATCDLARRLGLRMVAEGVESEHDLAALAALGCDLAQGFHLARPMPCADLVRWLDERAAADAA